MHRISKLSWCLLGALLLTAGCQKLHEERTVQVDAGGDKTVTIEAPKKEQKVSVEVSAPGTPVNVYVYLEKDEAAVKKDLDSGKRSDKVLASKEKTEQDTLQATIPANNAFNIMLTSASGKAASAKLKITGS